MIKSFQKNRKDELYSSRRAPQRLEEKKKFIRKNIEKYYIKKKVSTIIQTHNFSFCSS